MSNQTSQSEMKHTAEPWKYEGSDDGDASVGMAGYAAHIYVDPPQRDNVEAECIEIARMNEPHYRVFLTPEDEALGSENCIDYGNSDANAERIVACVNAMQGIKDPSAHTEAVKGLVEACEELLNNWRPPGCPDPLCNVCKRNSEIVSRARSALTAYQQSVGGAT